MNYFLYDLEIISVRTITTWIIPILKLKARICFINSRSNILKLKYLNTFKRVSQTF